MKPLSEMTADELRDVAFDAIMAAVGPRGLARFISENNLGSGDYARDRHELLRDAKPIEEFAEELRRRAQAQA